MVKEQFMPEEQSVLRQRNRHHLNSREKLVVQFLNGEATKQAVLRYIAKIAKTDAKE